MKLLFHFAYFSFFIPIAASVRLRNENDSRKLDGWFDEFETGQCEQDSNLVPTSGQLKAMIFNMYLLPCAPGMGNTDMMPCQEAPLRDARTDEIATWMKTRDEDVIMVQELFSYHDKIRDAMIEASYCHYVATTRSSATGSGLAIYSKYPIEEHIFEEWPNWTTSFENALDSKGVLYAKIRKGEEYVHVFNLHTTSTTYETGSQSDREEQFWQTRRMIDYKNINMNELVLVGGDMNTNRYAYENGEENYQLMLQLLGASGFKTNGNYLYTYDTVVNPLTASKYEGETHQELLDYMFYDTESVTPFDESSCEIIRPVGTVITDTNDPRSMLSDHLPVTCNISYPTANNPSPSDDPMFFAEVTVRRARVCDADITSGFTPGSGDSDPYVDVRIHINGSEHECDKTSTIDNTNDPEWNEIISCSNVQFQATDRVLISFDAYDDDSWLNGGPDFIGTGVIAVNPIGGDFSSRVPLAYGNCNEDGADGHLFFSVHLNEVQGS